MRTLRLVVVTACLSLCGGTLFAAEPTRALRVQEIACRQAAGFDEAGDFYRDPQDNAISLCEVAATQGHPDVLAFLGRAYYFKERYADARRLIEQSHASKKTDAQTAEFPITIAPDGEQVVTYTVHYSW